MSNDAGLGPIPERAFITSRQQVDALAGRMRMRVLKAAAVPRSVREMAEALGVPTTRLYYHVNKLEEAGFLDVVETRKSGARVEKIYRVAAKSFGAGPELAKNVENIEDAAAALAGLVLDVSRVEAEAALVFKFGGGEVEMDLARTQGDLTLDQVKEIQSRMEAILKEVVAEDSQSPDARTYSFTYLLVPTEVENS